MTLSSQLPDAAGSTAPRGIRRLIWALLGVLALIVVLFAADAALRAYAEARMEHEIEKALPAGITTPGLSVSIHGFSFFEQYLAGRFGTVDVEAPAIDTPTAAVSASLTATDIRFDRSFAAPLRLGTMQGTIHADDTAINHLVTLPDATSKLTLGKNSVTYSAQAQVLGLPLDYAATVRPEANGELVDLVPQNVSVVSGPVQFDVQKLLGGVLDGKPIPICIAPYLPAGLDVQGISISKAQASVTFSARDFSLAESTFTRHDSCSA